MLGLQHYLTTAYHPRTNGRAERFNNTIAGRLRHRRDENVAEHRQDCNEYVQPLTYAYNMQIHWTMGANPFYLMLTRNPLGIAIREPAAGAPQCVSDGNMTRGMLKRLTLRRLRHVPSEAGCTMIKAQRRYTAKYGRRVRFLPTFRPGDWFFVDRLPRERVADDPEKMATKLHLQARRPYKVVAVQDHTVKILADGLYNVVKIYRVSRLPVVRPLVTAPGQKLVSADPEALQSFAEDRIEDELDMAGGKKATEEA